MIRAQASIEYALLCAATIFVACLLVRFQTPVIDIARGIEHALSGHAPVHNPHPGHPGHHRLPVPKPCWCAVPQAAG